MVLPGCQDTGTAIIMGKKGQRVWTDGNDEEMLSRGVYDTYVKRNLRYSQVAPQTMFEEKNTGSNLPACRLTSTPRMAREYHFHMMVRDVSTVLSPGMFSLGPCRTRLRTLLRLRAARRPLPTGGSNPRLGPRLSLASDRVSPSPQTASLQLHTLDPNAGERRRFRE